VWELDVGEDGTVYAAASSLGGSPTRPQVDLLVAFRDGAWTQFAGAVDGPIWTLALGEGGTLYVGGTFKNVGGVAAQNVAAWDGEKWHDLGGTDGLVIDLAPHPDGGFVAVGNFERAGGVQVNGVARWDGEAWSAYGGGLDGELLQVEILDGQPLVGGNRMETGTVLARWNGSAWEEIGAELIGEHDDSTQVSDIAVDDRGRIYVVGQFSEPTNALGNTGGVAVLEDGAWRHVGHGMSMFARRVHLRNDAVYVGGYFAGAGGLHDGEALVETPLPSRGIARFVFPAE
jgi:hypothetical protein